MFIVFILCISSDGIVLRPVSVLSYVMVEKVESLLRGQWSAFNIYGASRLLVSFSFSLFVSLFVSCRRLVRASRSSVSFGVSCLLSRLFRLVSLCIAHRVSRRGVLSCGRFRVVFLRLVSRLVFRSVPSCRVAFVACGGLVWGVAVVMVFSCCHMMLGRWRLVSCISDWLGVSGWGWFELVA